MDCTSCAITIAVTRAVKSGSRVRKDQTVARNPEVLMNGDNDVRRRVDGFVLLSCMLPPPRRVRAQGCALTLFVICLHVPDSDQSSVLRYFDDLHVATLDLSVDEILRLTYG